MSVGLIDWLIDPFIHFEIDYLMETLDQLAINQIQIRPYIRTVSPGQDRGDGRS